MMDFAESRMNMVKSQVRPSEVTDRRLLNALLNLPRERFVPASRRPMAYVDEDILLNDEGEPRWLLEPMHFARLVQLAEIGAGHLVLDVGCGTGYSTAVLGRLADSVVGLESDPALCQTAEALMIELGIDNVAIVEGDLREGYPSQGPYDVIILEGAVEEVPEGLFKQLRNGGRLVAPVIEGGIGKAMVFHSIDGDVSHRVVYDMNVHRLPGFERPKTFVF
ncbi:protein-L-isoaspartate O-methyltransferase family protein [Lutibaculum baratangense]|nr:protein-L-isoaspartate O-methyltransferase [Lutibaculum baratangense]